MGEGPPSSASLWSLLHSSTSQVQLFCLDIFLISSQLKGHFFGYHLTCSTWMVWNTDEPDYEWTQSCGFLILENLHQPVFTTAVASWHPKGFCSQNLHGCPKLQIIKLVILVLSQAGPPDMGLGPWFWPTLGQISVFKIYGLGGWTCIMDIPLFLKFLGGFTS